MANLSEEKTSSISAWRSPWAGFLANVGSIDYFDSPVPLPGYETDEKLIYPRLCGQGQPDRAPIDDTPWIDWNSHAYDALHKF